MPFKSASYDYKGPFTAGEIADFLGLQIANEHREKQISDIASLSSASSSDFAFFDNAKYVDAFKASKAGICVALEKHVDVAPESMIVLSSKDPHRDYALLSSKFYANKIPEKLIHETAIISADAKIGDNVVIGAYSVIEAGVEIGDGSYIGSNVTIRATKMGKNCYVYPGACIGQDGFGFSMSKLGFVKIPQLGGVVIGDNVEIGANTTIDRGAGPNTIIGDNTKIDNLVQIAHNVEIGKYCVIVSQAGIAGSTKIGDYAVLGGQAGVAGHLEIGTGAQMAAGSGVTKNVAAGEAVGGYPAQNIRDWHKSVIAIKKLIRINKGTK